MRHKLLVTLIIIGSLCGTAVQAAKPDLVKELDLSPVQVKQVQTQRRTQLKAENQLREKIRGLEKELKTEMDKEAPDQARIRAMVREINQLRAQIFEDKVNAAVAAKKVLNREQQRKMRELQAQERLMRTEQDRQGDRLRQGGGDTRKEKGGR